MNSDQVAEAIKASGCAVTAVNVDGVVRLHSASQGIGFQVLWGNAVSEGEYVDLTLNCPLRIEGGILPEGVLADWHRTKRFVRAAQHGDYVVLEMDILAAGGITPNHLAMQMQVWSQMMGQFFQHLRTFTAQTTQTQAVQDAQQAMIAA
ncbi:YbjN domain-containing protein [Comamonas sp. Tr-654]|nr:YbjN domain-containing protein [Comamonas sp. Tr-654]NIF86172.1 YbjN domain-containing protein [Comamonas sp. Tr-654]